MFVGLLALPVALAGALPAVDWQKVADVQHFGGAEHRVVHRPHQLHRGVKVKVTGTAQGQLRPGSTAPVLLTFKNPNRRLVQMKRVRVKIVGITAPYADATHACTTADFAVRQMSRRVFHLPARRTVDLNTLRLPVSDWPVLVMLDRPVNQDGCKGAELRLRFKARGLRK
jgi:hypothetical protein